MTFPITVISPDKIKNRLKTTIAGTEGLRVMATKRGTVLLGNMMYAMYQRVQRKNWAINNIFIMPDLLYTRDYRERIYLQ